MYYINEVPNENGNYGNPSTSKSDNKFILPDELLKSYVETMGFAILEVKEGVVTKIERNEEAYANYINSLPKPVELTAAEKRENAYDNDKIIEWENKIITVTEAAHIWEYYAAEGNEEVCTELQAKIKAAKNSIREVYPNVHT